MNYTDVINAFAEKTGLSKAAAKNYIEALCDVLKEGLKKDGSVKIFRFGKFEIRSMKERTVTLNNKSYKVKSNKKIAFKPSEALKKAFN